MNFVTENMSDRLALISLTCYVTDALQKKGKKITCYDLLLTIGKDFSDFDKNTFLKSLGVICQSMMYGCKTYPDFNIKPKDMPKVIKNILDSYCPF